MKVIIARDYSEQCSAAADIIEGIVRAKPDCCLGLATGSSPVGDVQGAARRCAEEGLDFSLVHSVNLDEYIGLAPEHDQSYRFFMNSNLFDHINIDKANTYVAGGIGDVDAGIAEFNAVIERSDVDVQVLGVGPDGHLGFNEPAPSSTRTRTARSSTRARLTQTPASSRAATMCPATPSRWAWAG